jgi:Domain of unknown function (DUF2019)
VKRVSIQKMSGNELVEQFAASAMRQFNAELESDIAKQNNCVEEQMAIAAELKTRSGDQRSALLKLYDHPNIQVRLNAARLSLAVAPTTAREVIQAIKNSKQYPQAMDAGMCLWTLEQGIFKPS